MPASTAPPPLRAASYSPRCTWDHLRARCLATAPAVSVFSCPGHVALLTCTARHCSSHHACLSFRRYRVQVNWSAHGDWRDHCRCDFYASRWPVGPESLLACAALLWLSTRAHAAVARAPGTRVPPNAPGNAGILLGPSGLGQSHPCPTGNNAKGSPCDPQNPTLLLFPTHTPYYNGPSNIRKCVCRARCAQACCLVLT